MNKYCIICDKNSNLNLLWRQGANFGVQKLRDCKIKEKVRTLKFGCEAEVKNTIPSKIDIFCHWLSKIKL